MPAGFRIIIAQTSKQSLVLIWSSEYPPAHFPIITTFLILWAIALTIGSNDCHNKILEILLPV